MGSTRTPMALLTWLSSNLRARLDTTTGSHASFSPIANDDTNSNALPAAGKILVGGVFGVIGGQNRSRIARLDPAPGLADSFNPNADSTVLSIALQADGK